MAISKPCSRTRAEIKQPKRRAGADRERRAGAAVEGAGQARRRRAAAVPAVGARGQAARPRQAARRSSTRWSSARSATRIAQRLGDGAGSRRRPSRHASRSIPEVAALRRAAHLRAGRHASRASTAGSRRPTQAGIVAIWPRRARVAGTRPALAGIALALAPGLASYIPLGHRAGRAPWTLDLPPTPAALTPARPTAIWRAEAAARRPRRPQDRPRHEDRGAPAVALRRRARALRLHDADVLRARRRPVRPRDRGAGAALASSTT